VRRLLILAAGLAVALVAAGCGEDAQQQAARELLQAHLRSDAAYSGDAHCTDAAKDGFVVPRRTIGFICAVRVAVGGCDWWRVELLSPTKGSFSLYRKDAGCTLPP
jgi:hypothetical protein